MSIVPLALRLVAQVYAWKAQKRVKKGLCRVKIHRPYHLNYNPHNQFVTWSCLCGKVKWLQALADVVDGGKRRKKLRIVEK